MLVLVDACNVLHVEGALPRDLAGVDLGELAELVARSRYRHDEVILVMDGPTIGASLATGPSRIRAIASGPGRTADEVIIDRVERSSSPRSLVVVSSDRAIRRRARARRCRLVHSEAFLAQIGRDARLENRRRSTNARTPPSASTAAWLREFDLDDAAIARLVGRGRDGDAATKSTPDAGPDAPPKALPDPTPDAGPDTAPSPSRNSIPNPPPSDPRPRPASSPETRSDRPTSRKRRALEDVRSLEEIDPRELERFDMGEWIEPPPPPNMPDDSS